MNVSCPRAQVTLATPLTFGEMRTHLRKDGNSPSAFRQRKCISNSVNCRQPSEKHGLHWLNKTSSHTDRDFLQQLTRHKKATIK